MSIPASGDAADSERLEGRDAPLAESPLRPETAREAALDALDQRGRSGANWFYWVAALSLVNSGIAFGGGNTHFVIGLAVTQIVDALGNAVGQQAPEAANVIRFVTFGISLGIAGFVALFGWLSTRRYLAVYFIGMFLYLCDGLLYVWLEDWMSVGFHAFALLGMWNGFAAFRDLKARLAAPAVEQALA